MNPADGLSEQIMREIAESDLRLRGGLLKIEVWPWYLAMRRTH